MREMALAAYDRTIGLELADFLAVDGCITKAPAAARKRARARWIGANGAPNARQRWMLGASLWGPSSLRPTGTIRRS